MVRKERQSNIELLKVFAMVGVIILHYNNAAIGGALKYVPMYSLKAYILYFLECMCISAVDIFMLISGYFMIKSEKIDIKKPIRLLIQVVVFRILLFLLQGAMGKVEIHITKLIVLLLPTSYFAVLYVAVYLLSPFVNRLMNSLDVKGLRTFLAIVVILISVWPFAVDVLEKVGERNFNGLSTVGMYGSQSGYTLVNFLLMYIIGAYLRIAGTKCRKSVSSVVLLGSWAGLFIFSLWLVKRGIGAGLAWEYCNPLVILSSVSIFLLFNSIQIKPNGFINSLSKATFSVYLLNSVLILLFFNAKEVVAGNGFVMLLHIAVTCVSICMVSWVMQCAFDWLMDRIYGIVDRKMKIKTVFSLAGIKNGNQE